jgi:hypothetical protein
MQVQEGKPNLSKWTLRYSAFGQNFEFSWLARLLKVFSLPVPQTRYLMPVLAVRNVLERTSKVKLRKAPCIYIQTLSSEDP